MRSAVVADDAFPVQWTGRQAVVTLPEHIDRSSTDQVRDQLLRIINGGAAVLIADLSGTVYCDYCGAYALARAHQRARASGTELRLVATRDVARRVFTLNWLDRPVAVYPDLDAAIAAGAESRKLRDEQKSQVADHAARAEELPLALWLARSPTSARARRRAPAARPRHRAAHHPSPPPPR